MGCGKKFTLLNFFKYKIIFKNKLYSMIYRKILIQKMFNTKKGRWPWNEERGEMLREDRVPNKCTSIYEYYNRDTIGTIAPPWHFHGICSRYAYARDQF
jgi:hypothetical protein